jgi:hypothetical protein
MPATTARNRNKSLSMESSAYSSRGAVVNPEVSTQSPPGSSRVYSSTSAPGAAPIVSPRWMGSPHYGTYPSINEPPVKEVSDAGDIPFASPVGFMIDAEREMKAPYFWQNWKQIETTCVILHYSYMYCMSNI